MKKLSSQTDAMCCTMQLAAVESLTINILDILGVHDFLSILSCFSPQEFRVAFSSHGFPLHHAQQTK